MPNVVEIVISAKNMASGTLTQVRVQVDSLARSTENLSNTSINKIDGVLRKFEEFGAVAAAAVVDVGVQSLKMAADFDSATNRMVTQAGLPQAQLAGMRDGILKLAGSVGFDPNSLAEAAYHVASNMAGMGATSQQMLNIVKIAAEGAKVGGADLVDVTNALTAAVTSGIPGVQNMSQAMGILNATVGSGDMQMQDLANALGTGMLATVKGFGLSITDVGAALAVFGDNNIRGAAAGTQLRMSVQALSAPTKQGAALLDQMGISSGQLAKDMQSGGLLPALEDLKKHMDAAGISTKQQGQILTEVFGKKAGAGINILYDQLDRLQSKYPEITKNATGFGDAWQKTQQNLSQVWDQIKSGFDAMMVKLGEWLTPKLMDAIKGFREEWTKLEPEVKKVVKAFDFGGSLKAIQNDFKGVADQVKKDWPQIKEILMVVGAAILVIIKVILTLVDWVLKLDKVMVELWAKAADGVNAFVRIALAVFGKLIHGAADAFGWMPGIGPQLKAAAKEFDNFQATVNAALDKITDKNVTVNATIRYSNVTGTMNASGSTHGFYARGGVVGSIGAAVAGIGRAASGGVRGALTLVGEQGPELLDLPTGTTVHSNPDTSRMLAASPGRTDVAVALVAAPGANNAFAQFINNMIRTNQLRLQVVNNRVVAY